MAGDQGPQGRGELVVEGLPIRGEPGGDFRRGGLPAVLIQAPAVEGLERADAGLAPARVERRAVGRTVEVDHIARVGRQEQRGAETEGEAVELGNMPVRVRQIEGIRREARRDVGGQVGARVRKADQQRQGTRDEFDERLIHRGGHHHQPRRLNQITGRRMLTAMSARP